MFRRSVLALALACLATACLAGGITYPEPEDTVPGSATTTYLDLVRLIVPDIAAAGSGYQGHRLIDLRHVGEDWQPATPPDPIELGRLSSVPLKDGRLLLLADLGQSEDSVEGLMPLALFEVGGAAKLLDVIDVGLDRDTSFEETPVTDLGGGDLALTRSSHFNSSQNYVSNTLLLVRGDKITEIDTVFTFNDQGCSFERRQVPTFKAAPGKGPGLSDILVTVVETTKPSGEDCGDEPAVQAGRRVISATYRWDAGPMRYMPDSSALERLAKENSERF